MFESALCEHVVFVIIVMETDDPSTIRFLQGIASANLSMTYEMCHCDSPPTGKDRVFERRLHSSNFDEGLAF